MTLAQFNRLLFLLATIAGALLLAPRARADESPALFFVRDQALPPAQSVFAPHRTRLALRVPSSSAPLVAVARATLGSGRFTAHARAWCADALNAWLRRAGYAGTGDGRAISFARYGRPSGPHIGAIAVMRNHVGIVVGHSARGPVLISGNHRGRVGVGVYASHRIIAYREPV